MMLYFDHNATTPLDQRVVDTISECMREFWANPSSHYSEALQARQVVDRSRQTIAAMINAAHPQEIIFTSGGTESNNWVIYSAIEQSLRESRHSGAHVITTNIEHDSISEPLKRVSIERCGERCGEHGVDVSLVAVSELDGCVRVERIIDEIRDHTCLITVMMANNETGVIQPIKQMGDSLRAINEQRVEKGLSRILLHTDAAQAIGKISVDVQHLGVDFLTIAGHKFYGPRIGALYHRLGSPLIPLFYGGGQQMSLRPGTENISMIAGLSKASELVSLYLDDYNQHFRRMQSYLESQLRAHLGDVVAINCERSPYGRLPNTTSVAFNGDQLIGSRVLANTTSLRASVGAACHSIHAKEAKPSQILIRSGISSYLAQRTIRLSTGRHTSTQLIDDAIQELKKSIQQLLN